MENLRQNKPVAEAVGLIVFMFEKEHPILLYFFFLSFLLFFSPSKKISGLVGPLKQVSMDVEDSQVGL